MARCALPADPAGLQPAAAAFSARRSRGRAACPIRLKRLNRQRFLHPGPRRGPTRGLMGPPFGPRGPKAGRGRAPGGRWPADTGRPPPGPSNS